jgi:hypothetical protein
VIQGFDFVDGERKFSCTVEESRTPGSTAWWWFRVSTDDRQRYAPFRAAPGDTQRSVKTRIVAYYDNLLVRRAAPPTNYWQRGVRKPVTPTGAEAGAEAAAAETEATTA